MNATPPHTHQENLDQIGSTEAAEARRERMELIAANVAELSGLALDWAVAKSLGLEEETLDPITWMETAHPSGCYGFSTDPGQGGSIAQQHSITTTRCNDLYFPTGNESGEFYERYFKATDPGGTKAYGPAPLVAAMRCLVAAKLGKVIQIPQALVA